MLVNFSKTHMGSTLQESNAHPKKYFNESFESVSLILGIFPKQMIENMTKDWDTRITTTLS